MLLTDLIPSGKFHELTHTKIDDSEKKTRAKRIMDAYGDEIFKCLTECGPDTSNVMEEFQVMMATLCLVDMMIEMKTREQ